MTLLVVGINHRSAPSAILEKFAFGAEALPKVLTEVSSSAVVAEVVVLSTCNRTEVYVQAERFHDAFRDVRESLSVLAGMPSEEFVDHLYIHYDDEAVQHLFGLAAGLDSEVLGEHEILGQVRRAWDSARLEQATGALLNLLFQRAIEAGKRVRSETAIGEATASLSHAAVSLIFEEAAKLWDRPADDLQIMIVGVGDLGSGVAAALARHGCARLTIANRTRSSAERIADECTANVVDFADIGNQLDHADVVVCATGSDSTTISVDQIRQATRGHNSTERSLLVVDLAVPRDVDPEADALPNVVTLLLSDLQAFANRGLAARQGEVGAAQTLITEEAERHQAAKTARMVAPVIASLRSEVEAIRQNELERQLVGSEELTPEQREVVDALTRSVLAKVLHQPTAELKNSAGTLKGQRLSEAARTLFNLP